MKRLEIPTYYIRKPMGHESPMDLYHSIKEEGITYLQHPFAQQFPEVDAGYVAPIITHQNDLNTTLIGSGNDGRKYLLGGKSGQYPIVQSLATVFDCYIRKRDYKSDLESYAFNEELHTILQYQEDPIHYIQSLIKDKHNRTTYIRFLEDYHWKTHESLYKALKKEHFDDGNILQHLKTLIYSKSKLTTQWIGDCTIETSAQTAAREFGEESGLDICHSHLIPYCCIHVLQYNAQKKPFIKRCHFYYYTGALTNETRPSLTHNEALKGFHTIETGILDACVLFEDTIIDKLNVLHFDKLSMLIAHWVALQTLQQV